MVDGLVLHALRHVHGHRLVVVGLAEVLGLSRSYVVEIDVRVGRHGIAHARLFAAGVGHHLGVLAPVELLYAAKRSHRTLERLAIEDVHAIADAAVCHVSDKRMSHRLHIVVPVAVVEVCDQTARSQRQVGRVLLYALMVRQRLDEYDVLAIGRELVALDVGLRMGELLTVGAVGRHAPQLASREIRYAPSAVYPRGIRLAGRGRSELRLLLSVHGEDVEYLVTLVLLHAVIAHLVDYRLAVGRSLGPSYASHGPQRLGIHEPVGGQGAYIGGFVNHRLCIGAAAPHDGGNGKR